MKDETREATAEIEIREVITAWAEAVRVKDVDRIFAHYSQEVRAFDAIGQLQFKGADAYRKHWDACVAMCPGDMIFEIRELAVEAGDEVGFCHYLIRCGGTSESGEEKSGWMRATTGLRKAGGTWRIEHEHFSAPFDMESGKALMDLKP